MPNHVTTILTIHDSGGIPVSEIRSKFINDKGVVDFNVILPMPKCLEDFEPHTGILSRASAALGLLPPIKASQGDDITAVMHRLELNNGIRDATTPAKAADVLLIARAISNYAECGYFYWYDWSSHHWGTKWNCYQQPDDGHPRYATSFRFDTAWAHPRKLIEQLSRGLPLVTFSVRFADEDIGSNCGTYTIKCGQVSNTDIAPSHSNKTDDEKAHFSEMAFRIRHGDDEDPVRHGYDEHWDYSDEVYEAHN